jgi:formate dehydrogenase major subunit
MTNGWVDIKNTDMMLIMGGNPDAKTIVVDPRFTRTASQADVFCQIRAGSDLAFLGGLIYYALQNNRVAHEYLVNYTNAAFVVKDGFKLPEDGLFSGFDEATKTYDKATWNYEEGGNETGKVAPGAAMPAGVAGDIPGGAAPGATGSIKPHEAQASATAGQHSGSAHDAEGHGHQGGGPAGAKAMTGGPAPPSLPPNVAYDLSLQHPRCVYQLLKQQYSRYTPEMVERITGIPQAQLLKAWDLYTSVRKDGDMKKVGTVIYAVGWTQHSNGTQVIRAACVLQLLMGNVGRAGGGVNALRGHSNIQGATDMAGIFDILPGYLKMPGPADKDLKTFLDRTTPKPSKPGDWESFNYWSNTPKFMVSFLKAMYGPAATKENDFCFNWLPKIDRNYSWVQNWNDMYEGKVKGVFAFGMNGVMIGPDSKKNIDALKKADFLVVCEIYPDETSAFWQAPGTTPEEMKQINTTVYQLPGAGFAEKDGTFVNSARWLQWKYAALPTPAECRLDQDILSQIFLRVRELYKKDSGKFPDPIVNVTWNYTIPTSPSLAEVAKEINGKAVTDLSDATTNLSLKAGQQLPGFAALRDDGSTSSGNWIYCGSWTEAGPMMQRRGTDDPSGLGIYPNWGWSWPANRRVLYNRASCDLTGKPYDPSRRQIWWNAATDKWVGNDVPDFKPDSKPEEHMGPFIMNPEGVGRLFVPLGAMADGPIPEFYEPIESPIANLLHPQQSTNPLAKTFKTDMDKYAKPNEGYNIVCTTYRLTEHYHYWTKNNPMNVELVPEPFVEIPAELADQMGIRGGEKVKVSSIRADYIAKAMVTKRIKAMMVDGKKTYQIGIPIHWGYKGISESEGRTSLMPTNRLTPTAIDPNAYTPEFKGFLVKLEKV